MQNVDKYSLNLPSSSLFRANSGNRRKEIRQFGCDSFSQETIKQMCKQSFQTEEKLSGKTMLYFLLGFHFNLKMRIKQQVNDVFTILQLNKVNFETDSCSSQDGRTGILNCLCITFKIRKVTKKLKESNTKLSMYLRLRREIYSKC